MTHQHFPPTSLQPHHVRLPVVYLHNIDTEDTQISVEFRSSICSVCHVTVNLKERQARALLRNLKRNIEQYEKHKSEKTNH